MASTRRRAADALALFERLAAEPWRHGLYSVLRRIEALDARKPRLGTTARAADDALRLEQTPSAAFAPSTLRSFTVSKGGERRHEAPRLSVAFFGLFGPQGPLPLHLTEYARDRARQYRDHTFTAFANIFHHRLLTLFYRAFASAEPAIEHDRPDSDAFARYLGATLGMSTGGTRERDAMADYAKLYYAGRLSALQRNGDGLAAMLGDFLGVPVELQPYAGEWLTVERDEQWRLGRRAEATAGALGASLNLGARVYSRQYRFRLVVGPLDLAQYRALLPGTTRHAQAQALVRNYVGYELAWDLQLVLAREQVPPLRLRSHAPQAALGRSAWVAAQPPRRDADDLVIRGAP